MKVLIVDDSGYDRKVLKDLLKKHGHNVVEAVDGEDGLKKALDHRPDLIVSDVLMPKVDGFNFLRSVKGNGELKSVPFIILSSAYIGDQDKVLADSLGADGFLIKPADEENLWKELSKTISSLKPGEAKAQKELLGKDEAFLRDYSRIVAAKLEEKVKELSDAYVRLERSEEMFRAVAESANDAIICLAPPGVVILWNRKAEEIFGYRVEEVIGKDFHALPLLPEKYREKAFEGIFEFFRTGGGPIVGKMVEFSGIKKDGTEFPLELSVSAMRLGEEWRTVGIVRDITERKLAEKKLKEEAELNSNLLKVAYATAELSADPRVIGQVIGLTAELLSADICLAYIRDSRGGPMRLMEAYGLSDEDKGRLKLDILRDDAEFIKKAAAEREPDIVSGFKPSEGQLEWLKGIDTISIIPIGRAKCQGLVLCGYRDARRLAERDLKIMYSISDQLSLALADADARRESVEKRLELYRRIEKIKLMEESDRKLLSSLETNNIYETAVWLLGKTLECDSAAIAEVEKDGFRYKAGFGAGFFRETGFVPFNETNSAEVVRSGTVQYSAEISSIKALPPFEKRYVEEGFSARIVFPVVIMDEVTALIFIAARKIEAFTSEDIANAENILRNLSTALRSSRYVEGVMEAFIWLVREAAFAFDSYSPFMEGHSSRVRDHALVIGRALELDERKLRELEIAALLHDIGAIDAYGVIMDKAEPLTEDEKKMIREHPIRGTEKLPKVKELKDVTAAIRNHQEFYNGKGYPDGLSGKYIPLLARIIAVAEAADAMASARPYRGAMPMDRIIHELKKNAGTQFDPDLVNAFIGAYAGA